LQEKYAVAADDATLVAAWSGGRIGWAISAVEDPELLEQQQQRLDVLVQLGSISQLERMRWAEERAKEYRGGEYGTAVEWLRLWQSWWRDVLLVRTGNGQVITHLDRKAELESLAQRLSTEQVQRFLQQLDTVREQLADNVNPQLAFENVALHVPAL
jgi:DNA polymerase-3 subunit delta'